MAGSRERSELPQARRGAERSGCSERLLIVDPGDLRTRAAALALPGLEPLGALEVESAVAPLEAGAASLLPAYAGLGLAGGRGPSEAAPLPPIAEPGTGRPLALGAAAADVAGTAAYLAAGCDARRLDALVRGLVFELCAPGDRVDLVLVADPGAKADRLRELERAWLEAPEVLVTALDPTSGESESRSYALAPRVVDAAAALVEVAFARGALEPDGPPALVLDLGHRAARSYLVDPQAGLLDLEVVPHGGASYLEHARRATAEARDHARDVSLLRQLAHGTEMLSFGAVTRLARRFFDDARGELAKAIACAVAGRLHRHLERGGRWPAALLLCGGLALPDGAAVVAELRARGCAFQRVRSLPRSPSPLVEGAQSAISNQQFAIRN